METGYFSAAIYTLTGRVLARAVLRIRVAACFEQKQISLTGSRIRKSRGYPATLSPMFIFLQFYSLGTNHPPFFWLKYHIIASSGFYDRTGARPNSPQKRTASFLLPLVNAPFASRQCTSFPLPMRHCPSLMHNPRAPV